LERLEHAGIEGLPVVNQIMDVTTVQQNIVHIPISTDSTTILIISIFVVIVVTYPLLQHIVLDHTWITPLPSIEDIVVHVIIINMLTMVLEAGQITVLLNTEDFVVLVEGMNIKVMGGDLT
jgi:hypothetical protein